MRSTIYGSISVERNGSTVFTRGGQVILSFYTRETLNGTEAVLDISDQKGKTIFSPLFSSLFAIHREWVAEGRASLEFRRAQGEKLPPEVTVVFVKQAEPKNLERFLAAVIGFLEQKKAPGAKGTLRTPAGTKAIPSQVAPSAPKKPSSVFAPGTGSRPPTVPSATGSRPPQLPPSAPAILKRTSSDFFDSEDSTSHLRVKPSLPKPIRPKRQMTPNRSHFLPLLATSIACYLDRPEREALAATCHPLCRLFSNSIQSLTVSAKAPHSILSRLLSRVPNLRTLRITNSGALSSPLTPSGRLIPNLRMLDLSRIDKISPPSLLQLLSAPKHLQGVKLPAALTPPQALAFLLRRKDALLILKLKGKPKPPLPPASVSAASSLLAEAPNLRKFQAVRLDSRRLISPFPPLSLLSFSVKDYSSHDPKCEELLRLLRANPGLLSLKISGISLTEAALPSPPPAFLSEFVSLLPSLTRLEKLSLSPIFSPEATAAFADSLATRPSRLRVLKCRSATLDPTTVAKIIALSPSLQTIDIFKSNLNGEVLEALSQKHRQLAKVVLGLGDQETKEVRDLLVRKGLPKVKIIRKIANLRR